MYFPTNYSVPPADSDPRFMRDQLAKEVRGSNRPRGRGRGRRGRGSKNIQRDQQRQDSFREAKSEFTASECQKSLTSRLMVGTKDAENALNAIEAVHTLKTITLCITTRSIGFSVVTMFRALYQFNNVPVGGSIYEFYRVH